MAALKQIGDIQIFAEISQGAINTVYKGYQPRLERLVLLKVLRPEFSHDEKLARRFEEEARLIAKIQHPNVVAIYDYGRFEQFIYFATEYVEGFNLRQLLEAGKLPPELAAFILSEAAKGLKAAHDKKILHKDIKPSNILISHEGRVKLADFGMAALHESENDESQEVSGTLSYMAPEQILGNEIDTCSDIFSLGGTFVEMLTGRPAFVGATPNDSFKAILNSDPTEILKYRKDVPETLIQICKRMLMKAPRERYSNCKELLKDLQNEVSPANIPVFVSQLKNYLQNPASYTPGAVPANQSGQNAGKDKFGKPLLLVLSVITFLILSYVGFSYRSAPENPALEEHTETVPVASSVLDKDDTDLSQPGFSEAESIPSDTPSVANDKTKPAEARTNGLTLKEDTIEERQTDNLKVEKDISEKPVLETGRLSVVCAPWAYVYVDGDSLGQTPLEQLLQIGNYELTLKNPEFQNHTTSIEIAANQTTELQVSLWSLVGTLNIDVRPWAEIYIDGEYQDTVPPQARPFILTPGKHELELKHPDLGSWQTEIDVAAGETLDLKFNLQNLLVKK